MTLKTIGPQDCVPGRGRIDRDDPGLLIGDGSKHRSARVRRECTRTEIDRTILVFDPQATGDDQNNSSASSCLCQSS